MRRGRYGVWGKHLELFDIYRGYNDTRGAMLAESEGGDLLEGTGAPEGRADFPIFLQTVIRHRVRERFRSRASRWRDFVGVESVQDFRETTVSELGGIRGMGQVNEDGEYNRLRSSESEGPSFAIARHGGVYAVTYELIINDDTNRILNRVPRELGRMASDYVSQAVILFIESNPTYGPDGAPFFSAGRGNERTGAAADPTEDNMVSIMEAMKLQRDADGVPFDVNPRRILVRGDRQKAIFMRMIRSTETGTSIQYTGAAGAGALVFDKGRANPLYQFLPEDAVVDEPWLNDPNDYYVLGDAEDRPPFIAAFLRGVQEPFIGIKKAEVQNVASGVDDPYTLELDEILYKVRHPFGVAAGEPKAAMRLRPT